MKTWQWIVLVVIAIVIIIIGLAFFGIPAKAPTVTQHTTEASSTPQAASIADLIIVSSPTINADVSSPLVAAGSARGNWYFEASFPAKLLDASGKTIAEGHGQAQGDWMTSDFVPFTVSLTFSPQAGGSKGTLVLMNDNPSGDPAKQKTLEIPVVFK